MHIWINRKKKYKNVYKNVYEIIRSNGYRQINI